jgi:hypothetical protein
MVEKLKWHSNRHAPRNTKERKMRSKIRWFTEFCNSHYLSHFAAFFIDARAKRSVAESCITFIIFSPTILNRFCVNIDHGNMQGKADLWKHSSSQFEWNPAPGLQEVHSFGEMIKMTSVHMSTRGNQQQPVQVYSIMILPQVHLRKPCYDFYFL